MAKKPRNSPLEQEWIDLGWRIIEWKVTYYKPETAHPSRAADYEIDDETYDAYEQRYLTLCRQLGKPNSVVHKAYPEFADVDYSHAMMEVDPTRHSAQLVMFKMGSLKPR